MHSGEMRRAYLALFRHLAEMGIGGVGRLFDCTPREIEWEMLAFSKRAEEWAERAWLVGGYVALGVNAPARYPASPPKLRKAAATDADMKRLFVALAGRRGTDDDRGA